MEKHKLNGQEAAQGAPAGEEKYDLATCRRIIVRDFSNSVALMRAVLSDDLMIDRIAEVMYGRLLNKENKENQG